MRRLAALHPFLFGLFPVLSLLSGNLAEAQLVDAVPVALLTLFLVAAVLGISQLLIKDIYRSAVIASGIVLYIFAPFHVFLALRHWLGQIAGRPVPLSMLAVHAGLTLLIVAYIVYFARKAHGLDKLNAVFCFVSAFLVCLPAYTIALTKLSAKIDWTGIHQRHQAEPLTSIGAVTPRLPDIYYIIMDRYGGPQSLKATYGFDNHEFLDYLGTKGFYIAMASAANYPMTAQSLASSLNLQYINYLENFVEPGSTSWIPIQALLQEHRVGRVLKSKGYRYIHLGSWWEPTRKNKLADENVYFTRLPEMFFAVHGTTIFEPISSALGVLDFRYQHWVGNRRQFENVMGTVAVDGPKFVFAHFLLPHEPYVFGRDGEYLSVDRINGRTREANYVDQLVYTNRMLKKTIDFLLSKNRQPPVIVLQADEGPYPRRYEENQDFDWKQATAGELNQKMKILNSYLLPGVEPGVLYSNISPVNTFRVIFNSYLKTNLALLPDESFVHVKPRRPYQMLNVTAALSRN